MGSKCDDCPRIKEYIDLGGCPACKASKLFMNTNTHIATCDVCGMTFGIPMAVERLCWGDIESKQFTISICTDLDKQQLLDVAKMIDYQFYSLDLYTGKTNFKLGHNILCFFIVEHPCDEAFIKEQALQLLMTPCRNFEFYGAYSRQWENGFDDVDIMLHPDDEDMDIALTSQWNDLDEFIDALHLAISSRYFVPCDTYLIYDDEPLYRQVIERLKQYEDIKRYYPDW